MDEEHEITQEGGGGPARPDEHAAPAAARPDERAAEDEVDEQRLRAALDELRRLRVEDLAGEMIVTLVTVGYQKMGVSDQTRELRDLAEARLAIELLRACVETLARERGEAVAAAGRSTLDAMQLDFARVVMAAGEPPGPQAAATQRPKDDEGPEPAAAERAEPADEGPEPSAEERAEPADGASGD